MIETSATLLDRLRDRGDAPSWQRLLHLYTPVLRHWLNRQDLQRADVDDLVQQVFTVLVDRFPEFLHNGRTGAFRTWLRTITGNCLRTFWRTRPARLNGADPQHFLSQLEDPESGLSREWDREHDRHVVRQLLALLQDEFTSSTWKAFQRLVLDEAAPEAVAAELNLSVNAVFIAKSRVLRRLRQEGRGLIA